MNEITKSAFSQARRKFKHQAFVELNREQVEYFYDTFSYEKWKGYRLVAIDGSTCRLPNSDAIINEFGIADTSETGTPIILARLSQAYDMLNHVVIDAELAKYGTGEHVMAQGHIDYLKNGDLILFDRNYASFWIFSLLLSKGINFCARLRVGSWTQAKNWQLRVIKKPQQKYLPAKQAKRNVKNWVLAQNH